MERLAPTLIDRMNGSVSCLLPSKSCKVSTLYLQILTPASKNTHSLSIRTYHKIKSCKFVLVFCPCVWLPCSKFDFSNLHVFWINYLPPWPNFRYPEHQDAQVPGQYPPSPPLQRHKKTKHTVDKQRKSLEKQAHRVLRGIDNQVDSAPTSPRNYSDSDSDDEMARTQRSRETKKRAQAAISGGAVAQPTQPARRRGQGRAPVPQDDKNGAPPRLEIMNTQLADLLAQLNQNPRMAAALTCWRRSP